MSSTPLSSTARQRVIAQPESELWPKLESDTGRHGGSPLYLHGRPALTTGNQARIEAAVVELLHALGEEPEREGLSETPARVAKSLQFLTAGYQQDPREAVGDALFEEPYDGLIAVKDIDFFSLCEHHLLPFFGRAHVAYLPDGKIVGLSKIPRLVEAFARRLQVQERLTSQIAAAIDQLLSPHGVAVVLEANHLCMAMRGVQKQNSRTVTTKLLGAMASDSASRREALLALGLPG